MLLRTPVMFYINQPDFEFEKISDLQVWRDTQTTYSLNKDFNSGKFHLLRYWQGMEFPGCDR
jgi:hypothetical protein